MFLVHGSTYSIPFLGLWFWQLNFGPSREVLCVHVIALFFIIIARFRHKWCPQGIYVKLRLRLNDHSFSATDSAACFTMPAGVFLDITIEYFRQT